MLQSLAKYRFLTAEQIRKLHFPEGSQSYCNERLRALFHKPYRYVDRRPLPLEWGKGSPKLVYTLTKRGADRLKEEGFFKDVTFQSLYKLKQGTAEYKKHEIAVNEFMIAAEQGAKQKGWEMESWISEADFKHPSLLKELKAYDPETGRDIPVAPDGFFSLYFPEQDKRALFFLELDRGTMEIARFRYKKIRGYTLFGEKWREIETFRKYKDLPITFRVLNVIDGGEQRMANLLHIAAEKEFESDPDDERLAKSRRFYFSLLKDITPESVFSDPLWLVPYRSRTPEEKFALIDFERSF